MDWTLALARLIELETFASVWYWMAVIVTWSVASNWLIGVPFDMLFRARKLGEVEIADLEALVDINVRRIVSTNDTFAVAFVGLAAFILSALAITSFGYGFELAQGLFVLAAPLTIIVIVNMRLAYQLYAAPLQGRALVRRLFAVRLWTQVIGMISLFFTAMYGIYQAILAQQFF